MLSAVHLPQVQAEACISLQASWEWSKVWTVRTIFSELKVQLRNKSQFVEVSEVCLGEQTFAQLRTGFRPSLLLLSFRPNASLGLTSVMERWSSGVNKMETTAGVWQQSGFICSAADNFQHTPKSSHAPIDQRKARAARNTRYRYNKIAPLDHKMADDCVSLARTNTVSSTINKPIKT